VPAALVKHNPAAAGVVSWYFLHMAYAVANTYHCTSLPRAQLWGQGISSQQESYSAWSADPDVQCFKGHHAGLTAFVSVVGLPLQLAYVALHIAHLALASL
jgi:hypothetical protein